MGKAGVLELLVFANLTFNKSGCNVYPIENHYIWREKFLMREKEASRHQEKRKKGISSSSIGKEESYTWMNEGSETFLLN